MAKWKFKDFESEIFSGNDLESEWRKTVAPALKISDEPPIRMIRKNSAELLKRLQVCKGDLITLRDLKNDFLSGVVGVIGWDRVTDVLFFFLTEKYSCGDAKVLQSLLKPIASYSRKNKSVIVQMPAFDVKGFECRHGFFGKISTCSHKMYLGSSDLVTKYHIKPDILHQACSKKL